LSIRWWSSIVGDTYPFDNIWNLNLVDMKWKFGVWLMPSSNMCKEWKCIMGHAVRMFNVQFGRRLLLVWQTGIETIIILCHAIIFSLALDCFGFFCMLKCNMPLRLVGLIVICKGWQLIATWWHVIGQNEIYIIVMLMQYEDHMCKVYVWFHGYYSL
jgi:hypothetical protein